MTRRTWLPAALGLIVFMAARPAAVDSAVPARGGPFAPVAGCPLAVVVLVDLSKAAWPVENTGAITRSVEAALKGSLKFPDRFAVAPIAGRRDWSLSLRDAGARRLDLAPEFRVPWPDRFGNVLLWDAMEAAIEVLQSTPDSRRALLVSTAGRASGNLATPEAVTQRAGAAGVVVGVLFRPSFRQEMSRDDGDDQDTFVPRPESALQALVAATAGRFVESTDTYEPALQKSFESLLQSARYAAACAGD